MPVAATIDAWRLVQSNWLKDAAAHDETLFALANGAVGVRGGFEESASTSQGTFVAGVWERVPIHHHERYFGFPRATDTRMPVADATAIGIRIGNARIDPVDGECLAFERALDLRRGTLSRSVSWRTAQGHTFQVQAQRIVSFAHPGLVCIRWTLRCVDYSGPLTLDSSIFANRAAAAQGDDPRVGAGSGFSMQTTQTAADKQGALLAQRTRISEISVVCAQRHRVTGAHFVEAHFDANSATQSFSATVQKGSSVCIEKYIAYAWSAPFEAPADARLLSSASMVLDQALAVDFDAHLENQAQAFACFWKSADLSIDNAPRDEQALRFNLFHLFQSAGRDGTGGIAAKGLTGEGYEGHVFWDSETFVLPVLALTAPALVKPSLLWRLRTLDRARAHAREMNHSRGALYPWRTIDGDECSAHYPSGSAQYHINAAVAFAIKLYVDASDDRGFLLEGGAEMLFETARIWLQIGSFNARRDHAFCICDVTGPDEYTALIDNNYYTNRMAQQHLRYAVVVAREVARDFPSAFAALQSKIALDLGEIDAWTRAADAMYLGVDARLRIIAQDDNFLDRPLWDFAGTPADKYPLLMHFHPLTLYRHQVCKQADALLALVLAGSNVDRETKRRTFDYYEKITVHDSTLSASTFAIAAAEVGYVEKAERYFLDTLRVDLDNLHANTSHGAHMAAMAGSWLTLAWGFAGLRIGESTITFDPVLPPAWSGYRFGMQWKNRRLSISVDAHSVRYTLIDGAPLEISHAGEHFVLAADVAQSRALSDHTKDPPSTTNSTFPGGFKAVIFDLDGVLADTAHLHHAAWKRLADELDLPWSRDFDERLKGVDREGSLQIILGAAANKFTDAEKQAFADRKNGYYRASIASFSDQDLLPGARAALLAVRAQGLKIGLASASRSAGELVARMGIADLFDHIVDSVVLTHAKPHPEIFQRAAAALGVDAADCLGIEDAQAGIAAIKSAGMAALGIGDAQALKQADAVLPNLKAFDVKHFVAPA